jgi:hypothetical protein
MITRRSFIKRSSVAAASALLLPSLHGCEATPALKGTLAGPNVALGHKVRDLHQQQPARTKKQDVVIAGAGVAGLSAARWLSKNHIDFTLLELENEAGGNSRAGTNAVSDYPLGAHYLPIPSIHHKELLQFLEESNVITGYENNLPVYNEYYLCFDPKERLFINHHWQEGLIPHEGIPLKDREEIESFLKMMDDYRQLHGDDGKPAFTIPLDHSSQDRSLLQLDQISMQQFLIDHRFTSPYLNWYVDYCCADDYGATINEVSAWAGIHYFASRKGEAANARIDDVLTWPEGNYFLIKQLRKGLEKNIESQCVVLSVQPMRDKVLVDYWDDREGSLIRLEANKVIMATPQFVNKHLLRTERVLSYTVFQYAPWMVANLTTHSTLDEKRGEPLSWDNVIYGSRSLGYVHATHQNITVPKSETVITYYQPLTGTDTANMRKMVQQRKWNEWADSVFDDLQLAHPSLRASTSQLGVWIWGHGMIRPQPGFVWGQDRAIAKRSIDQKIFFAHSDLSGVSIFEEAFNSGIMAARDLLKTS